MGLALFVLYLPFAFPGFSPSPPLPSPLFLSSLPFSSPQWHSN